MPNTQWGNNFISLLWEVITAGIRTKNNTNMLHLCKHWGFCSGLIYLHKKYISIIYFFHIFLPGDIGKLGVIERPRVPVECVPSGSSVCIPGPMGQSMIRSSSTSLTGFGASVLWTWLCTSHHKYNFHHVLKMYSVWI